MIWRPENQRSRSLAAGLLACLSLVVPAASATERPNVVLILVDDLDSKLGSMAYMPQTRAVLAAVGTSFSNYIISTALCCPTRATILTGQYAHNHGVLTVSEPDGGFLRVDELGLEQSTLAVALQQAGYRTALLGKYFNGYPAYYEPAHVPPGWDEWSGVSLPQGYAQFAYQLNHNGELIQHHSTPGDYLGDVLTKEALAFVERTAREQAPFFLYLAPIGPHRPAEPAPKHATWFPRAKAPRGGSFNEADVSDKPAAIRELPQLTAADISHLDSLHRRRLRALQTVDVMVGRLLKKLLATGQLANTYLIFTSDNGFHLGQHRMGLGKNTIYEEDIRVPLIIRGPGVPVQRTVSALALPVDLAPTIAALAGVSLPLPTDGRSLVPLWSTSTTPPGWRKAALLEFKILGAPEVALSRSAAASSGPPPGTLLELEFAAEDAKIAGAPAFAGYTTGGYKYAEHASGERELYDLRRDPSELDNLSGSVSANQLAAMSQFLADLRGCRAATCRVADSASPPVF